MNIHFNDINLEMLSIVLFLGIGLIMSIAFCMENIASVIIGAFAGYLARTITTKKESDDNVKSIK